MIVFYGAVLNAFLIIFHFKPLMILILKDFKSFCKNHNNMSNRTNFALSLIELNNMHVDNNTFMISCNQDLKDSFDTTHYFSDEVHLFVIKWK